MATVTETIEYLFTDGGSLDDLRKKLKRLSKDADASKDDISRLEREIERLEGAERSAARATRGLSDSIRGIEGVGRILGGTAGEVTGVLGDLEAVGEGAAGALGPAGLVGAFALLAAAAVPVGIVKTVSALIELSRSAVDARDTLEELGGLSIVSDAGLAAVADLDQAIDNLDAQFSRLLVELSPALIPVIDLVADAVGRVGDQAQRVADLFAEISPSDIARAAGGAAGAAALSLPGMLVPALGTSFFGPAMAMGGGLAGDLAAKLSGLGTGERAFASELDPETASMLAALGMTDTGTTTTAGPDRRIGTRTPIRTGSRPSDPQKAGRDPASQIRFDSGPLFQFYTRNIRELEKIRDSLPKLGTDLQAVANRLAEELPTADEIAAATSEAAKMVMARDLGGGEAGGQAAGREAVEDVLGEILGAIPVVGGFLEAGVGILDDLPAFFKGLTETIRDLPGQILIGLADTIADSLPDMIESIPAFVAGIVEGIAKLLLSPVALIEGIISAIGRLPDLFVKAFTGLPVKLLRFVDPEENGLFRGPNDRVLGIPGTERRSERVPLSPDDPGYGAGMGGQDAAAFRSGGGAILIGGWNEAADSLQTTLRTRRSFGGGYAGP